MTPRQRKDIFQAARYADSGAYVDPELIWLLVSEVLPGITLEEIRVFFGDDARDAGMEVIDEIICIFEDYLNQVRFPSCLIRTLPPPS